MSDKITVHYDGKPLIVERKYPPLVQASDEYCPRCGVNDWEPRGEMDGYYIFRCRQCRYYEKVQG